MAQPEQPSDLTVLRDLARTYLERLSDEERLDYWRSLMDGYCTACGRRLAEGERACHCEDDE